MTASVQTVAGGQCLGRNRISVTHHGSAPDPSATSDAPAATTVEPLLVHPRTIRKAITGTAVGNFMEWFGFGIYGYLAVTMTTVFTSGVERSAGLLITLFGFAVSFVVRPIGGLILGPLGDRIGRKSVLFLTMALMAIATTLIGVLPTSQQIGLWAIVPLYLLRLVQGFSTGGEYAGATTYVSEFSPDKKRGFYSAWLDVGSYIGFAAGAGVVGLVTVIVNHLSGPDAMLDYGWRIPFLSALPLGAAAIYFRMRIPETPVFEEESDELDAELSVAAADDPMARHGVLGIIRHHWRPILVCMALVSATQCSAYALTSYMPTYLEEEVGVGNLMAALATVPVLIVLSFALPFLGRLSDRIGRKPIYWIAVVLTLITMVPAFAVMRIGTEAAVLGALFIVAVPTSFYLAVSASALPALFPTATRFGAMGIAFNLAVSLFGGTTPLICQWLIQLTGNPYMPAFYIMFFAVIAGIALVPMKETAGQPLMGSAPVVEAPEDSPIPA